MSTGASPLDLLKSSSDDEASESVHQVRVQDKGSRPQCIRIQLQGVPVYGSGADISIIGGDLFRCVASAAHLKKQDFKSADKFLRTYDQKPFSLDGRMDLDVTFDGQTMRTPIYVKMDLHNPLLLSEGVASNSASSLVPRRREVARRSRDSAGSSKVASRVTAAQG